LITLTLVGLLAFLELLRGGGLTHIVIEAIALAVAALPGGLLIVVTVTLALGMHKVARQPWRVRQSRSRRFRYCGSPSSWMDRLRFHAHSTRRARESC